MPTPAPEEFAGPDAADALGTWRVADGRLVLNVEGRYESALIYVGDREFRPLCPVSPAPTLRELRPCSAGIAVTSVPLWGRLRSQRRMRQVP